MNEIDILQKSFEEFNQATVRLQESYARLEEKFAGLNREMEAKNIELEKAIAEKKEASNYLENILSSLITGVVVTDLEGKIRTVNRCAEVYFEESQASLQGRHIGQLLGEIFEGGGKKIFTSASYESDTGVKIRKKGKIFEVFGSPVRAWDGRVSGTVFAIRDITKIEMLEDMAKRTEKLVAMGEMAANIAHEIRNPLGSIELFASLLVKELDNEKEKNWASHIIASVKNMDNKISNLLIFARNRSPVFKRINIHDVLKDVIVFSRQLVDQENISLSIQYADFEPVINGDAEMLKQVFLNLILNALQAMPDGGILHVTTNPFTGLRAGGRPASYVEIKVADSGTGIKEEHLDKIFDPFFSTRERGSGLGLAIVHSILDMHQGLIVADNRAGGGAVLNVLLPLLEEGSGAEPVPASSR
jgi:PAS domain S-box-containing protein